MSEFDSPTSVNKTIYSNSTSPSKRRRNNLAFPSAYRILESPNHRATVETNLYRIPDGSEALSPASRELEKKWNNRFQITFSKDNKAAYTKLREYFDSPRKFEEGIPRKPTRHPKRRATKGVKRFSSLIEERESLWSTRYAASSEWNEVKHKTLRNYFDELPKN